GNTALHFAVKSGRPAVVEMLLHSNSLNPNAQNKKGKTALSSTTDPDMISVLLQSGKVDPNLCDFSGQTLFHDSVHGILSKRNSSTIYKLLFELDGVSPDPKDESGRTPLFFVALFDKEIIVKMLLEMGKVNPECEDCFGWTPLQCAQKKEKKKDTRLL
ncbi:ankyrin repeat domain-containing protein, partial [Aspergillus glaucus CBS 516.65]